MSKRLWRRTAKKQTTESGMRVRNGRHIKQMNQMQEFVMTKMPKTYPLLSAMFDRAGIKVATPAVPVVEEVNEAQ